MVTLNLLIDTLKHELRARHIRYQDIAKRLDMSEANVKRMFSSRKISSERFDLICEMMELDIIDLIAIFDAGNQDIEYLSESQEEELASDMKLLLVALCARNYMTIQEITDRYEITEPECIHLLAKLDGMGLISLLPNNRIRLRISEHFRWQVNGPIFKYFNKVIMYEFLDSKFTRDDERKYYLTGRFTPASHKVLLKKVDTFKQEFEYLHREESNIPVSEKQNVGILLALRSWEFSEFEKYRRNK